MCVLTFAELCKVLGLVIRFRTRSISDSPFDLFLQPPCRIHQVTQTRNTEVTLAAHPTGLKFPRMTPPARPPLHAPCDPAIPVPRSSKTSSLVTCAGFTPRPPSTCCSRASHLTSTWLPPPHKIQHRHPLPAGQILLSELGIQDPGRPLQTHLWLHSQWSLRPHQLDIPVLFPPLPGPCPYSKLLLNFTMSEATSPPGSLLDAPSFCAATS